VDYQQSLEKAVLEYASSAASRMKTRPDKYVQIPGYPDPHVWGMAAQLHQAGLLSADVPDDNKEVGITDISDSGSARLKELRAEAMRLEEAKKREMDEAIEQAKAAKANNKWWKKLFSGNKATV